MHPKIKNQDNASIASAIVVRSGVLVILVTYPSLSRSTSFWHITTVCAWGTITPRRSGGKAMTSCNWKLRASGSVGSSPESSSDRIAP